MILIPEASVAHLCLFNLESLMGFLCRMQILNVYYPKYEMGGKLWPVMHNAIVFSLVLTQVIALGVFTIKRSPVTAGFTILLLVGTVLFNEYCRHRFSRIFEAYSAQVGVVCAAREQRVSILVFLCCLTVAPGVRT